MKTQPAILLRVLLAIINAGRWLVPASRRREWRRQWRADLWHESQWLEDHPRGISGTASLIGRAAGAWRHAFWLRGHVRRLETISHDLRYGWRLIVRKPGFTAVAVLTLALGIGANVLIYSHVETFLRRPIPGAADPSRLMLLDGMRGTRDEVSISHPDFRDYRNRRPAGVDDILAYTVTPLSLRTEGGEPQRVWGQLVSASYFSTLGVGALIGRTFLPEEDRAPNGHPVAVISHRFWRQRFAADPLIIGKPITVNGHELVVIGVTIDGFRGNEPFLAFDIWLPLAMQPAVLGRNQLEMRRAAWLQAMVRVHPEADIKQVQAGFDAVARDLAAAYPENKDRSVRVFGMLDAPGRSGAILLPGLTLMMALAGIVLLIACANVANLLLSRAIGRQRETAVRLALGAGRARVLQQLITESALVALAGGIGGVAVAYAARPLLESLVPPMPLPIVTSTSINGPVLVFAFAVTMLSALAFGIAPALQGSAATVMNALKASAVTIAGSRKRTWMRQALVVAQVSASLVLLVSACLFVRSLQNAHTIDPGFSTRTGLAASIDLTPAGYDRARGQAFFADLLTRVREVRGVDAVSVTTRLPLIAWSHETLTITVDGYSPAPNEEIHVDSSRVGTDYMRAMGVAILKGREFTDRDDANVPDVGIVNETLARRYFAGRDPLGGRVHVGNRTVEIVGVVADGKYTWITEEQRPFLYLPHQQWYRPNVELIVKTAGDPATVVTGVKDAVRSLDANLALFDIRTMRDHLRIATMLQGQITRVLTAFGAVALLLAMVGLYGVIATTAAQRTGEIGMRMALGATRPRIIAMVLAQGLRLTMLGVVVGLAFAFAITRLFEALLVGVDATDALSFTATIALLVAVALAAAYIPARRAASIDVLQALRQE